MYLAVLAPHCRMATAHFLSIPDWQQVRCHRNPSAAVRFGGACA